MQSLVDFRDSMKSEATTVALLPCIFGFLGLVLCHYLDNAIYLDTYRVIEIKVMQSLTTKHYCKWPVTGLQRGTTITITGL